MGPANGGYKFVMNHQYVLFSGVTVPDQATLSPQSEDVVLDQDDQVPAEEDDLTPKKEEEQVIAQEDQPPAKKDEQVPAVEDDQAPEKEEEQLIAQEDQPPAVKDDQVPAEEDNQAPEKEGEQVIAPIDQPPAKKYDQAPAVEEYHAPEKEEEQVIAQEDQMLTEDKLEDQVLAEEEDQAPEKDEDKVPADVEDQVMVEDPQLREGQEVYLVGTKGEKKFKARFSPSEDRIVHCKTLLPNQQRFLITHVYRNNISDSEYDEDVHIAGTYIAWSTCSINIDNPQFAVHQQHRALTVPVTSELSDQQALSPVNLEASGHQGQAFYLVYNNKGVVIGVGKLDDKSLTVINVEENIDSHDFTEFVVGSVIPFNSEKMKSVTKLKLYKIRDVDDKTIGHARIIPSINQDSSMAKILLTECADDQYCAPVIMMWSKVLIEAVQTLGEGKKKRGRGRKRGLSPETWTRNKRPVLRIAGKTYVNTTGKIVPEKMVVFVECGTGCKNHCSTNLPQDARELIFQRFYNLDSETAQNTFIKENVCVKPKVRTKVGTSRRQNTREFSLDNHKVCKTVFLKTLAISNGRADRVISSEIVIDGRGKHGNQKTVHTTVKSILNEIMMKLPRYDSHYHDTYACDNNDVFLAPHLTLNSMYGLLKEEITLRENLTDKDIPSIQWFHTVFKKEYPNIKISSFKKDTCDTCNIHKINGTSAADHLRDVEMTRQLYGYNEKKDYTITSDMMAVLPLPKLDTNTVYYKRQLSLYTQGVHWTKHRQGFLYLWLEDEGNKGATEVITCLHRFFTDTPDIYKDSKRIILWTDTPSSQNRNYSMLQFFLWCVNNIAGLEKIIHRFFVKGHSYMACDRDFGHIKKMINNQRFIYTKSDYVQLMEKANSKKPLKITELETSDFLDFTEAVNFKLTSAQTSLDNEGNKFYLSKCKELVFNKGQASFDFKYDWEADLKTVQLKNKELRDNGMVYKLPTQCLKVPGWKPSLGISQEKYNDLQALKKFIPPNLHSFYDARTIKTATGRGGGRGGSAVRGESSRAGRAGGRGGGRGGSAVRGGSSRAGRAGRRGGNTSRSQR